MIPIFQVYSVKRFDPPTPHWAIYHVNARIQ